MRLIHQTWNLVVQGLTHKASKIKDEHQKIKVNNRNGNILHCILYL